MNTKRIGFSVKRVYKMKKPRMLALAKQKLSFMVASFSLFAFVMGNMVGQHGWYAFWKTVMGKEDDALIAFVGFVAPVSQVPDYTKWAKYGGNPEQHTYRMVPKDVLVPLPDYDINALRARTGQTFVESVYSVGNLGDYENGADHGGSHVGIDIRVPLGTPILSIGNGVVQTISMQEYGYGHYVMIRHPNVPDASNPGKTVTVYSIYAHMDAVNVIEGQIVHKGEAIGTSGQTGFASGPHLHFQVDNDQAPYHPYWPFTSDEANSARMTFTQAINAGLHQERGDEYTVSPMLLVQQYRGYVPTNVAQSATTGVKSSTAATRTLTAAQRIKVAREERAKARQSRVATTTTINVATVPVGGNEAPLPSSSSSSRSFEQTVQVPVVKTASTNDSDVTSMGTNSEVSALRIVHNGTLSQTWQKITIVAIDRNGETVKNPSFSGRLYVIPEFGEATIRPSELSPLDFVNGVATVNVLARGSKTLFIATRGAFNTMSAPMVFSR